MGYNCAVVTECYIYIYLKAWYRAACTIYWVKAMKLHSNQRAWCLEVRSGSRSNLTAPCLPAALLPFSNHQTDVHQGQLNVFILYEAPTMCQALGWVLNLSDWKSRVPPWRSLWCAEFPLLAVLWPLAHLFTTARLTQVISFPANRS